MPTFDQPDKVGEEGRAHDYSPDLVARPGLLPLENETSLPDSGIVDSLPLLRLTLLFEEQFGLLVQADELVPENFATIPAVCAGLRGKQVK